MAHCGGRQDYPACSYKPLINLYNIYSPSLNPSQHCRGCQARSTTAVPRHDGSPAPGTLSPVRNVLVHAFYCIRSRCFALLGQNIKMHPLTKNTRRAHDFIIFTCQWIPRPLKLSPCNWRSQGLCLNTTDKGHRLRVQNEVVA